MKDIIIGLSLLWLVPWSIIITRLIFKNLKNGVLKDE